MEMRAFDLLPVFQRTRWLILSQRNVATRNPLVHFTVTLYGSSTCPTIVARPSSRNLAYCRNLREWCYSLDAGLIPQMAKLTHSLIIWGARRQSLIDRRSKIYRKNLVSPFIMVRIAIIHKIARFPCGRTYRQQDVSLRVWDAAARSVTIAQCCRNINALNLPLSFLRHSMDRKTSSHMALIIPNGWIKCQKVFWAI